MNWLILLYFLEIGYAPIYSSFNVLPNELNYTANENVYYINFDAELILLDHFFIGGSTKTYIQPVKADYQFFPIENDFLFKAGFRLKTLELGFRHQCNHPVGNFSIQTQGKSYGGFEEFYIRISNKY